MEDDHWELAHNAKFVDSQRDGLYAYDNAAHQSAVEARPWKNNPRYFKRVRISALALTKMVTHARSGGSIEVMGLMQGYVDGDSFVVMDAFRLPVEGTETRVNAHEQANEYMVSYSELCRSQGARAENPVGWYHSHPGYGCWLSGIDVDTQEQQQSFNEPFLAVVIDPERTTTSGKVDIGAFRSLPKSHRDEDHGKGRKGRATEEAAGAGGGGIGSGGGGIGGGGGGGGGGIGGGGDDRGAVPAEKEEDFGAHASRYYSLEVSHFKSTLDTQVLDLLWNKYWAQTLGRNPLYAGREFATKRMHDVASRLKDSSDQVRRFNRLGNLFTQTKEYSMEHVTASATALATTERTGLAVSHIKARVFNGGPGREGPGAVSPAGGEEKEMHTHGHGHGHEAQQKMEEGGLSDARMQQDQGMEAGEVS